MKLILHIGQSKTGTTAIQAALQKNRGVLSQQGILYPDYYQAGIAVNTPHHNSFAESLCGFTRYPRLSTEEYIDQFKEQEKTHHTMILSGESFFGMPHVWRLKDCQDFFEAYHQKLNRLKLFSSRFKTEVIVYLRRPEEWFESAAAQIIRFEGLFDRPVYENDTQLFELLKPHMSYQMLLNLWQGVIGPEKVHVLPYVRESLVGGDAVQDFMHHAGINASRLDLDTFRQDNTGLDRRLIEIKKELNKSYRNKKPNKTRERVIHVCLDRLNRALDRVEKYNIEDALRQKIKAYTDDTMPVSFPPVIDKSYTFLSSTEIDQAMRDFERLYSSWSMKFLYAKIKMKTILRQNCPQLYAVLKGLRRFRFSS